MKMEYLKNKNKVPQLKSNSEKNSRHAAVRTFYLFLMMLLFCAVGVFFCLSGKGVFGKRSNTPKHIFLKTSENADADVSVTEEKNIITVVIDAGHGGEDGGTVGKNGVFEKDINLRVSKLLEKMLVSAGFRTVMTRSEDVLLYDRNTDYKGHKKQQDLATRLKTANSIPDSVFVSIHMNAFAEQKYSGLQVYYSKNNERSKELAVLIQNNTAEFLQKYNTRKPKAAGSNIYLLDRTDNPAVLVECGFLSNAAECERLCDPVYQKQLAFTIFKAICESVNAESAETNVSFK